MTEPKPTTSQSNHSNEPVRERTTIDHVLGRLSVMDLPAKEHFENYLRHKWRVNHKPKTIEGSFTSIMLFLRFYGGLGKTDITQIERSDLEAFIEHEQERGMYISTVRTRMVSVIAFLHFLMEQEILSPSLFKKRIKLKLPETLPRAMNPKDVKKLIDVIHDTRDRALILLLLRTGMRIGEVLGLTMNDIDLTEKKVRLMEGEKNEQGPGRVSLPRRPLRAEALVHDTEERRSLSLLWTAPWPPLLQCGTELLRQVSPKSPAGPEGLYGSLPAPHVCFGVAQCRDAPGGPPAASRA